MASENDARVWLRANGYVSIAEKIDSVMGIWRERGVKTRRNWWDVLAGGKDGSPRTIEGISFPVLAAVRRRNGLPPVQLAIEFGAAEAPKPTPQARWQRKRRRVRSPSSLATRHVAAQERAVKVDMPPMLKEAAISRNLRTAVDNNDAARTLSIGGFAQLAEICVPLRDLVVLVGAQATGKSLVLQILKLIIDRNRVVRSLKQHGFNWTTPAQFTSLYFGGGFENSWNANTTIDYGNEEITFARVAAARARKGEDAVFYIPAHRTLAIPEGWPRPFTQFPPDTPYVARHFSEELLTALNQGLVGKGKIFPHDRRLKDAFRNLINDAVFHQGVLKLETLGVRKQLVLEYDQRATLPFMAWSAGQREFTPLLLGLYHLLPPGGGPKKKAIQWVILEEPEMGLHPKAIVAVMAVVLDLLARGYKVALSTHSPTVLELVWGMSRLRGTADGAAQLCSMMGLGREKKVLRTAADALKTTHAVIHFQHNAEGRVTSQDISKLDPGATDPREWEWGGLTRFSTQVAAAVAATRA